MFNYNYPMSTPNYSLSDIAAASGNGYRNNDGGMWGDGAWWIIILFLFFFIIPPYVCSYKFEAQVFCASYFMYSLIL